MTLLRGMCWWWGVFQGADLSELPTVPQSLALVW